MWLSDFEEAIAMMKKFMGNSCWCSILTSYDGSRFIFHADTSAEDYWVWYRGTNRIEHCHKNTWRTGEKEIFIVE